MGEPEAVEMVQDAIPGIIFLGRPREPRIRVEEQAEQTHPDIVETDTAKKSR